MIYDFTCLLVWSCSMFGLKVLLQMPFLFGAGYFRVRVTSAVVSQVVATIQMTAQERYFGRKEGFQAVQCFISETFLVSRLPTTHKRLLGQKTPSKNQGPGVRFLNMELKCLSEGGSKLCTLCGDNFGGWSLFEIYGQFYPSSKSVNDRPFPTMGRAMQVKQIQTGCCFLRMKWPDQYTTLYTPLRCGFWMFLVHFGRLQKLSMTPLVSLPGLSRGSATCPGEKVSDGAGNWDGGFLMFFWMVCDIFVSQTNTTSTIDNWKNQNNSLPITSRKTIIPSELKGPPWPPRLPKRQEEIQRRDLQLAEDRRLREQQETEEVSKLHLVLLVEWCFYMVLYVFICVYTRRLC